MSNRICASLLFLLLSCGLFADQSPAPQTTLSKARVATTVLLVRHAEKIKEPGNDDPALTPGGQQRSRDLVHVVGAAGVQAVYATQYLRTQATAEPLATKLGLKVQIMDADKSAELVSHILKEHVGQTILVVGHSDTVPEIIEALGGPRLPDLGDDEYDSLFVVTVTDAGGTSIVKLRYGQ